MQKPHTRKKPWKLVKSAKKITRPLGTLSVVFGLTVMAGYALELESLYRPIENGPATNPLTALCIILIGIGLRNPSTSRKALMIQRLLAFSVLAITSIRLFDGFNGSDYVQTLMPFKEFVLAELATGKSNGMGENSALMFFSIALSTLLYGFRKFQASQFAAFISLTLPTISFTGYAYGINNFYGQMSMITSTAGIVLAVSALSMSAHTGALRSVLSPYIGGRIARYQTLAAYVIPTLLGFLLVTSFNQHSDSLFGIFVVAICWFAFLIISVSAIFQEKIDAKRRHTEELLAVAAMNDQLTGLPNRRSFFEFAQNELERIKRRKSSFWLLVLDIDFFKHVNDTAGHDMGDEVLKNIARVLNNSVRQTDLASRIGGEEFGIILIDADQQGAERVAETVRKNVELMVVPGWTEQHGQMTISIGCAENRGDCELKSTLKYADQALYKAKQSGRNRVVVAEKNTCNSATV